MSSPPLSASALASGQGSTPVMHWCHECGIEIRPLMTPGPTCPRCNGQFVEEIDPANPIANDDVETDVDDEQVIQAPRPFAGAERRGNQDDARFTQSGLDLGSLVGNVLRGLASAGSQPRPTEYATPNRSRDGEDAQREQSGSNGSFRTGTSQAGPISFSWGMSSFSTSTNGQESTSGSSSSGSRAQQSDTPFAGRAPMGMNEFLRQSFHPNEHHHDDGMGGAGGAADGRFFNSDNRDTNRTSDEGRIDDIDEVDDEQESDSNRYPPEMASIRDVFANLFGGMGDGPAGMLLDMFGGGNGSGRSGDYVWGQRGLDDVITQLMEQTRGSTAPPPASEEAIKRLQRFSRRDIAKVRQARNRECSTCMDSFEDEEIGGESNEPEPSMDSNKLSSTYKDVKKEPTDDDPPEVIPMDDQQDELMMMPCKHLFHLDCLLPWLQTNGTCPVCRVSLETDKDKKKDKGATVEDRRYQPGESSSSGPTTISTANTIDLEDEDESPEAIRLRSRQAAEARRAESNAAISSEPRQSVPGGYHLQPDELD